jgi:8-oxo-dGTP pyrophosphatase MutT (NUDIX family)
LDIDTRLAQLRSAVGHADHLIDGATYPQVRDLFDACCTDQLQATELQQLSPEYGKEEHLLPVDGTGTAVHPSQDVIEDYRAQAAQHPGFAHWLQEAPFGDGQQPILLVARWLCHLVGFRHQTVELFLDHPAVPEYTLIQVRSLAKVEAPGCFDLPAAGHLTGVASPQEGLYKELEEELGLTGHDINDVQQIGSYDHVDPPDASDLYNAEHRTVFAGRLKGDALPRIRFVDHEVAAVAIYSLAEIQMLLDAHPERVASGLAHSWPLYLATRGLSGSWRTD